MLNTRWLPRARRAQQSGNYIHLQPTKTPLVVQLICSQADADKCGLQHLKDEYTQNKLTEERAWRGSQNITHAHVNVSRLQVGEAAWGLAGGALCDAHELAELDAVWPPW